MQGKAIIYRLEHSEPEIKLLTEPSSLELIKGAVDGWIEQIPYFNSIELDGEVVPCVAFCNEEGKLNRLPVNVEATWLWDRALRRLKDGDGKQLYPTGLYKSAGDLSDVLVGNIIVFTGDADFMAEL